MSDATSSSDGGREFFTDALSEAIYTAFRDTDPIVFEFIDRAMSDDDWSKMVDRVVDKLPIKINVKIKIKSHE